MFRSQRLVASLSAMLLVQGQIFPYTPIQTLRSGKTYELSWQKDPDGWNETTISLFSGSNDITWGNALENITTLDAGKEDSYKWNVPNVTPCANIYFLQFSQPGQQPIWTGRFAICASGEEVEPGTIVEGTQTFGFGSLQPSPTDKPKSSKGKKKEEDKDDKSDSDEDDDRPKTHSNATASASASASVSGSMSVMDSNNSSSVVASAEQLETALPTQSSSAVTDSSLAFHTSLGLFALGFAYNLL